MTGRACLQSRPAVLLGDLTLIGTAALTAVAVADINPAEPVFAGHYPGFPILPGVCVIEYVRRAAWLAPPPGGTVAEFNVVEAARFLAPVRPGDRLRIEISWVRCPNCSPNCSPSYWPSYWRCTARVSSGHGPVATVRLHFPTVRDAQ